MKNRIFSLILAVLTLVSFSACGTDGGTHGSSSGAQISGSNASESENPDVNSGVASLASGVFDNVSVKVVGADCFVDAYGNPAIRVYIDYTNTAGSYGYFNDLVGTASYQNDKKIYETTSKIGEGVPEQGNQSLNIQPGCSLRVVKQYIYDPDNGDVTFYIFNGLMKKDDGTDLSISFDLNALPGAPTAGFVIAAVSDPQWNSDWPEEGDYYSSEYHASIKTMELIKDKDGGDAIRLYFDYTNNSGKDANVFLAYFAVQDGVSLIAAPAETVIDSDDCYKEIASGETAEYSVVYTLRSGSPVEFYFKPSGGVGVRKVFKLS